MCIAQAGIDADPERLVHNPVAVYYMHAVSRVRPGSEILSGIFSADGSCETVRSSALPSLQVRFLRGFKAIKSTMSIVAEGENHRGLVFRANLWFSTRSDRWVCL